MIVDLATAHSRIRVRGGSRVDFLHRMSTGDLLGIQPGQGRATVFTTPIGRMVDYAVVLALDDSLLLISGGYGQSKLIRWLRKYIFYNDDVQLEDESAAQPLVGIFGSAGTDIARELYTGAAELAPFAYADTGSGILVKAAPLQGDGYYLINPQQAAATPATAPLAAYDDMRIRAGYAGYPNEINENYIPLEAGLVSAVSFGKGCYIGQEIIARMESRGKVAKQLAVLESDAAMRLGDEIRAGGSVIGKITSVTSDGRAALGYLRSAAGMVGQAVQTGEFTAHVAGLARL